MFKIASGSRFRILIWMALAAALLSALVLQLSGCMSFRLSQGDAVRRFQERDLDPPEFFAHQSEAGRLFLAKKGQGPSVVLVHGSPGSWSSFISYFYDEEFLARHSVLAVDRPGFGESLPARAEPSLEIQARRIAEAVRASGASLPAVWLGHSLGGPVVAQLAADYPDMVHGLVLVAPSIDPDLEKRRWFNWLAEAPPVRWLLPRDWRNSNREIFPHKRELQKLAARLGAAEAPAIVIHGDKDGLVPVGNAYYARDRWPEGRLELRIVEGANHFLPWTYAEKLKRAVSDLWLSEAQQ